MIALNIRVAEGTITRYSVSYYAIEYSKFRFTNPDTITGLAESMKATKINNLLHSGISDAYRAKVGETLKVALPQFPITAETEFVQLDLETSSSAPFETLVPDYEEGSSLPNHVIATAFRPGSGLLRVTATDAITQEPIPDVDPLEIKLTAVA